MSLPVDLSSSLWFTRSFKALNLEDTIHLEGWYAKVVSLSLCGTCMSVIFYLWGTASLS